jgi:hypothetical protein
VTIGIGACGPGAGLAVFRTLAAAERVATGAIGGFAVFAAIGRDGTLHTAQTQRGGSKTLFTSGETTGVEPPPEIASAPFAGVISSGPDRPEPLGQFLVADPTAGLVTGHRLPNMAGSSGVAVNRQVLGLMLEGADARTALRRVLDAEPGIDAGMIALGPERGIAALNSRLVSKRPDIGQASLTREEAGVEILFNAIRPRATLAPLLAEIAMQVMLPDPAPAGEIVVRAGTAFVASGAHRVIVDADNEVVCIETDVAFLTRGRHNCAAVYLGAPVVRDGVPVGRTLVEPNVIVEDGRIVSLSGQRIFAIPYACLA